MGKKQARIDELEAQVEELMKNELKILAEWSNSIGKVRMFIPPAVPMSDPADKKIIENQKQAILELHKQVLELHKQVDVLADQRNNAIDRAERAEAKSDGWSDAYTNQVGALHEQCDQLRDELAELKAKPSLVIPDSYKVASLEQEIRSLNLYITRLTNQLDNIRLAAR